MIKLKNVISNLAAMFINFKLLLQKERIDFGELLAVFTIRTTKKVTD